VNFSWKSAVTLAVTDKQRSSSDFQKSCGGKGSGEGKKNLTPDFKSLVSAYSTTAALARIF